MALRTVWQNQFYPLLFFAADCFKANTFLFLSILGLTLFFDGSAVAVPLVLEYTSVFNRFSTDPQVAVELGIMILATIHCIATISIGTLWSILCVHIETDLVLQTYRARYSKLSGTTSKQETLADAVLYAYFTTATTGIKAFLSGYLHFFFRIGIVGFFSIRYAHTTHRIIFWILCLGIVGIVQHFIYITTFDHINVKTKRQLLQDVALSLLKMTPLVRERRQEKIEEALLTTVLNDYVSANTVANKRYMVEHVWYFIIFFTGLIGGWEWFRTHSMTQPSNSDLIWCVLFVWIWLDGYLKLTTHVAEELLYSLPVIKTVITATPKINSTETLDFKNDSGVGRIVFEDVFYGKEGGDEIKNVNLIIPKTAVVGLVSTGIESELVLQLILDKHQPTRGKITIDYDAPEGQTVDNQDMRIAYLGIEPILMERSIIANLSYGLPTPLAPMVIAEIIQVLELSSLITRLPKGLNTVLTPDTLSRLTDGEKQLLAVGRALLFPSPIMVLDHALDRVALSLKLKVIEYICKKPRTRTVIIITARLAALHPVDKVFVFHKGCLVEEASPAMLLSLQGHYHKMYFAQAKLSLITQTKK